MDDRLRELMQELGNAINETLSDSDRIAAAIGEIKRAGYDVFLVLEATIGFNKRAEMKRMTASEKTALLKKLLRALVLSPRPRSSGRPKTRSFFVL